MKLVTVSTVKLGNLRLERAKLPQGKRADRDSASWLPYRRRSVTRRCPLTFLTIAILAWLLPLEPAFANGSAVARPHLPDTDAIPLTSTVFFLKTGRTGEVAAVGTAHAWKLPDLAKAGRVEFLRGNSRVPISSSTALLVPPGRPFNAPGGTLAGDFFVFALDSAPRASEILELESDSELASHQPGHEVLIRGIPAKGGSEVHLTGQISKLTAARIQVELDEPVTLSGWGGAPVVSKQTGHVIGIVQASAAGTGSSTILVGPISVLHDGLRNREDTETRFAFADFSKTATDQSPAFLPRLDTIQVHLEVEFPADGAVIPGSACGAFIAGRATARRDQSKRFDVALVLDTSGSTAAPTGADINGNGIIGTVRHGQISSLFGGGTDEGDSILAAEVAAARQILRDLDPTTTRVTIVTFAGSESRENTAPPALTRQPLTHEYARAERALDSVLRRQPRGGTHISGAVDHAVTELLGLFGSSSAKNPLSEKLIFFFTDGHPTLPFGALAESANTRSVRWAAERAYKARVRIHSFAIGPEALASPIASVELADFTGGSFIPVRHPGELQAVVDAISFTNLEDVTLRSATTDLHAHPFRISPDGSWGGFLKVVPGLNLVEIAARSADGIQTVETLRLIHEPSAEKESIPRKFGVRYNRLLEDCLHDLKQQRAAAEQEHGEKVRGELLLEIDRERTKARQRAAEQRKELKLEVEDPEPPSQ